MEKAGQAYSISSAYISLTKPGILFGNAVTAVAGFVLASRGHMDFKLFLATLIGLCLIMASACVFNNYIDRRADAEMARTKNRVLVQELISARQAIVFAIMLVLLGTVVLAEFASLLSLLMALIGFFVYVMVYSFSKYRSLYATWIGSIAGAVPPVVGYCAVSGIFDLAALLLFFMVALWQLPHFFAIAIYRLGDYTAASIPVLPRIKGVLVTKMHMLIYTIAFIPISSLLAVFGYVGYGYLFVTVPLGVAWAWLCLKGFRCANDTLWAKKMFFFSLIIIMAICLAIPFTVQIK